MDISFQVWFFENITVGLVIIGGFITIAIGTLIGAYGLFHMVREIPQNLREKPTPDNWPK